jgi:hypothetical protein
VLLVLLVLLLVLLLLLQRVVSLRLALHPSGDEVALPRRLEGQAPATGTALPNPARKLPGRVAAAVPRGGGTSRRRKRRRRKRRRQLGAERWKLRPARAVGAWALCWAAHPDGDATRPCVGVGVDQAAVRSCLEARGRRRRRERRPRS